MNPLLKSRLVATVVIVLVFLAGMAVGVSLHHALLDRGWPDYNFPAPLSDPTVTNYRKFLDWQRANKVKPKKFVKETVMLEAVGDAPPPGFVRVRLSDLMKDD